MLDSLIRRRNLIFGIILLCLLFGAFKASLQDYRYVGWAMFKAEKDAQAIYQVMKAMDAKEIARPILLKARFLDYPEFNPRLPADDSIISGLMQKWRKEVLPLEDDKAIEAIALQRFADRFAIEDHTSGGDIIISFASLSPTMSQAVINQLAAAYLTRINEVVLPETYGKKTANPAQLVYDQIHFDTCKFDHPNGKPLSSAEPCAWRLGRAGDDQGRILFFKADRPAHPQSPPWIPTLIYFGLFGCALGIVFALWLDRSGKGASRNR